MDWDRGRSSPRGAGKALRVLSKPAGGAREKRSEQCRGLGKPWETVGKYGEHMRTWRVFMGESIGKHRKNMGQYRKTMGTYGKQREDMNKTTK